MSSSPPCSARPSVASETAARHGFPSLARIIGYSQIAAALQAAHEACRSGASMVLAAVRAYATMVETCHIWREEFGVFEPSAPF